MSSVAHGLDFGFFDLYYTITIYDSVVICAKIVIQHKYFSDIKKLMIILKVLNFFRKQSTVKLSVSLSCC